MEFMKKAMDWILEKEKEAAKDCHASPEDIEKQIKMIEEKKADLEKKYKDDMDEFEHILNRLHSIKAASLKCQLKN